MLTPAMIKDKAVRKWPDYRDHLLKSLILEEPTPFFPLIIRGDTSLRDTFSESAEAYTILLSDTGHGMIFSKANNYFTFNSVRDVTILVNDLGRRIAVCLTIFAKNTVLFDFDNDWITLIG